MEFGRWDLLGWVIASVAVVFVSLAITVLLNRYWIRNKGGRARLCAQGSRIPHLVTDFLWVLVWSAGVLMYGFALMEPKTTTEVRVPVLDNAVVVIALDRSRSCLAEDVIDSKTKKPISRCEFEDSIVLELAPHVEKDRLGILAFAQTAIALEPITLVGNEQRILYDSLRFFDPYFVEYIIPQGSNIAAAVSGALKFFDRGAQRNIFILLSDGENTERDAETEKALLDAKTLLDTFRAEGHAVSFILVGIGAVEGEGSPMPAWDYDEKIGCYTDTGDIDSEFKKCKLTRPNPEYLAAMARRFGGTYIHAKSREDVKTLLLPLLSSSRAIIGWKKEETMTDLSFYFVLAGFCLLFVSPLFRVP